MRPVTINGITSLIAIAVGLILILDKQLEERPALGRLYAWALVFAGGGALIGWVTFIVD